MQETRVLLVFPGSLFGGRWADGPRVKPELVQLFTELRRAGYAAGRPRPRGRARQPGRRRRPRELPPDRRRPARRARGGPGRRLLLVRPAVLGRRRRRRARPPAAAGRRDRRLRPPRLGAPGRLQRPGRALRLAHRRRGGDGGASRSPRRSPAGERETGGCHSLEGTPLPLDAEHLPDYAAYPYTAEGLPELGLFLSRGCPYNAPACLLRPGGRRLARLPAGRRRRGRRRRRRPAPGQGAGPRPRVRLRGRLAARRARPAGGRRPARPRAQRHRPPRRPAAPRRRQALPGAPAASCSRSARSRRRCSARTGQAPYPQKAVAHALELLEYLSAKGVVTRARFEFNQPGETEESAAETLDALERFVVAVPNTSVTIDAQPWAFLPIGEEGADVDAPASRFGTRIEHPEWWKERADAHAAATAVVASHELAGRAPGDESYWRPRFEELREALAAKLTADARRGLRSHETVGSERLRRAPRLVDGAALALTAAAICPCRGHRLYFLGRSGPR